jgi:hypothetical protein
VQFQVSREGVVATSVEDKNLDAPSSPDVLKSIFDASHLVGDPLLIG